MKELKVSGSESGQRLDRYLSRFLNEAPAGFIYKMLRKKNITLNGKKAAPDTRLMSGDTIKLFLSDETIEKFRRKAGSSNEIILEKIYEDEDLVFVNKPAGMLSQKNESGEASLAEFLKGEYSREGEMFSAASANRLDRNTSGLVLCGMTLRGIRFLSEELKTRRAEKNYLAFTFGQCDLSGTYKAWLFKDARTNKAYISDTMVNESYVPIETEYEPLCFHNGMTLIKVGLKTGRPHQIRAHSAYLGFPLAGDIKYGNDVSRALSREYNIKRQMLHSYSICFKETTGYFEYLKGREFTAPLPEDMKALTDPDKLHL